jgi:hypothetical protein
MFSLRKALLAVCVLTAVLGAQTTIVAGAGAFIDISPAGNGLGTAITGVTDDSVHTITTTIGNGLFPAGTVRVGNNGFCLSGSATATMSLTNAAIAATGLPTGVTAGAVSYLAPFWDDLDPIGTTSGAITLYWWEDTANSILYIQWNNDGHFSDVAGQTVTFQVQVFGGVNPDCLGSVSVKYAYADVVFGGTQAAYDLGASATVGFVKGTGSSSNALFSFNTASLSNGLVLDVSGAPGGISAAASSPGGPGDLQIALSGGPCAGGNYVLAVTLIAGSYPTGWLYGLDIPVLQLVSQVNSGFPFYGPMIPGPSGSGFTIGPFGPGALPSGLQFWAVALLLPATGNGTPTASSLFTYVIP